MDEVDSFCTRFDEEKCLSFVNWAITSEIQSDLSINGTAVGGAAVGGNAVEGVLGVDAV